MKSIDIQAALAATKQIKDTTDALLSRKADLTEKKAAMLEANQVIYRQPLLQSEIKDLMFARIDKLAGEYSSAANWQAMFDEFAFPKAARPRTEGPMEMNPNYFVPTKTAINLQDLQAGNTVEGLPRVFLGSENLDNFFKGGSPGGRLDTQRACFFFGDLIKKKIDAHFDRFCRDRNSRKFQQDLSLSGATLEEKRKDIATNESRIANLDAELSDIDAQLKTLTDAAAPNDIKGGA